MRTAEAEPTTQELPARDVCRVLQPIFPKRVVSMALLNHYKTYCGVTPSGGFAWNGNRSRCYTLNEAIALAAALDLNDIGIPSIVVPKLLKALQEGKGDGKTEVVHKSRRYSVSYDHRPIAEKVREQWDAIIKKQKES